MRGPRIVASCVAVIVALAAVVAVFLVGEETAATVPDVASPAPTTSDPTPVAGAVPTLGEGSGLQVLQRRYLELQGVVGTTPLIRGSVIRAAVQLRIAGGYHVNANPPSEDWIIPTELSLEDPAGLEVVRVVYPQAQDVKFDFWPEPLRVYEGTVVAGLEIRVADEAGLGDRNLEVAVRYQACNDEACFAPTTETLTLPVVVAEAGADSRAVSSPLLDGVDFESAGGSSH